MTSKIDHISNDNDELYRSARQYVELGLPIILLLKNHHPPLGLTTENCLTLATILRILNY